MGGLWEAAIKSAKTHLKSVMGETSMTFEELSTLFASIEACLNSRPLSPLSSDPTNMLPLIPGHFLIGTSLTALPEKDLVDQKFGRLTRFQVISKSVQDFWRRWSREYICQLQTRSKWSKQKANERVKVGAMVILRDKNLPPMKWKLGRITDLHPGRDGLTRVISVKTMNGIVKRAIAKICLLPIDD